MSLTALLDVHLMLLQDEELKLGVKHWIRDRLYNAEWALTSQLEVVARQFDEMEDEYLRERKADLEQITEKVLRAMRGISSPIFQPQPRGNRKTTQQDLLLDDTVDVPLILVAHDLSPADMLQFKQSVFAGFITDVGGKTSHTAIVARSLDIPAVVGARWSSQLMRQDDWVIIDGDAGVVVVDPSPIILAEYGFKQRQGELRTWPPDALAAHPRGDHGWSKNRIAGQHRNARRCCQCAGCWCGGCWLVSQRVPVHGSPRQAAQRGRAIQGVPACG
jgi:phosphotransferase system enzyme I (PtsI)